MPTNVFVIVLAALLALAVIHSFVLLALWHRPNRSALQRDSRIGKLEADYEDLHTRVQRLAGRIGRAKRDENEAEPSADGDPYAQRIGETGEQWKRRMRIAMQSGKLTKPG